MASRVLSPLAPEDNLLFQKPISRPKLRRSFNNRKRLRVFGKNRRIVFDARNGQKKRTSKVAQWEAARRLLKSRFRRAGITSCEAGFPHECWREDGLSFAHSKKRADIVGDEIYEVALLCPSAHMHVEAMPTTEMRKQILAIIAARARQP